MQGEPKKGWRDLLALPHPFRGDGCFSIPAYSDFMPGPYVGRKPYGWLEGGIDRAVAPAGDDYGFGVSEYQELHQLRPGLQHLARHLGHELRRLGEGKANFSHDLLDGNPYWPEELAARAGSLAHERYVLLLPLALSRTLDDKGRVRWTLFGASEQGPARPFWQSFRTAPDRELPAGEAGAIMRRIASAARGGVELETDDLRAAGFRILPTGTDPDFPWWDEGPLPPWAAPLLLGEDDALVGVRQLLTFRPFARLPAEVRAAYLDGSLQLLPFPGSLVFFGHAGYRKLSRELPLAMQIPLLHSVPGRQAAPTGMRVPQSGWLEEPHPDGSAPSVVHRRGHGPVVSHVKRTHRWNRTHRDQDETQVLPGEDRVAHVLFSTDAEQLGLYGKPMARNAQIWTVDHHLLLDGPRADGHHGRRRLDDVARTLAAGGHFGYRFLFPAMRVGRHDVYWQRPLCVFPREGAPPEELPPFFEGGPTGYFTAYDRHEVSPGAQGSAAPVELWPRIAAREPHLAAAELFLHDPGHRRYSACYNVRKLLEASELLGKPLERSFARALLTTARDHTLDEWLGKLPARASDPERARRLVAEVEHRLAPVANEGDAASPQQAVPSLTYGVTAHREFEERYWRTIAELAEGEFINKDNADLAGAGVDLRAEHHLRRLGDHLHARYRHLIERHDMKGKALVADHDFRWRTDFDFPWSGGWVRNQTGVSRERNVVMVIPGRDRAQAVIMADHYDTAYMEDVYEPERGGDHTRRSAAGADDNHSATAALLMAAEVLLPLSKSGQLARDVWLVHLTGEEFPSDCLGARNLVERLVEGNLWVHAEEAGRIHLSSVKVMGAYILDMVAHNNDRDRYVFQISPGEGVESMRLAERAHRATERWNRSVPDWNRSPARHRPGPSPRMESGAEVPPLVAHPELLGEVRPGWHFASSLYNTDAQILSDAGIPVVLFMENYDINRHGYHDTEDTMKNIDLDYGSAVAAIAIESVATAATDESIL